MGYAPEAYVGDKADSLLVAAKKAANAAGVPWAQGLNVYRALQDRRPRPILPKSIGRNVVAAYPVFVADFIIGLSFAGHPLLAEMVWAFAVARSGERHDYFGWALGRLTRAPATADEIKAVELRPDLTATITWKNPSRQVEHFDYEGQKVQGPRFGRIIGGEVFAATARAVNWVPVEREHLPVEMNIVGEGDDA